MASVLRLHSDDQRISLSPDWKIEDNSGVGKNETYAYAYTLGADLFFLFRGWLTPNRTSAHSHGL